MDFWLFGWYNYCVLLCPSGGTPGQSGDTPEPGSAGAAQRGGPSGDVLARLDGPRLRLPPTQRKQGADTRQLGQIGGTTLRDELQRFSARLHRREDPTRPIGARDDRRGESFIALNDVSFDMKPGERVGIIGRNGAGKSTLLKLISRVTAPTGGMIGLNGRVASMPEVGTGFHGELTGRENIYMNGAILGMTKRKSSRKWRTSSSFRHADPLGKRKWGHIILDNMTLLNSVFSDSSASEPLGPG